RRSLSGAQPPGTTTASTVSAETASTSTSAVASSPFLPCTGWVVSPATVTWAPSSCRRITVTQNSRSSNPSANSTTTLLPSSRPAMSHLQLCVLSSRRTHCPLSPQRLPGRLGGYQGGEALW